ncbi:hypothetical protein [Caminicella sporogenes]|uniref:hypothetical protein n=1 Tax=Caminicella sporogenes TaxID=166485 RepID=UPI00253FBD61|nr:hypothetical protein [Caminicella sporogenes]WIF95472.1 hypothetical protein QNI18_02180 [Caminicella sporogenes]
MKVNNSIKCEFIPDFDENRDFNIYYSNVVKDFNIAKSFFPLITLTILPTNKPKEIFITGNLIPVDVLKRCLTKRDIERYSIYILGIYPSEFPDDDIHVEDFHKKIDWSRVPYKHKHENIYIKNRRKVLCTHHPNGEINKLTQQERTVAILSNAWKLYRHYKEYLKTGKWAMKDLRHGHEGTMQLKKTGRYFNK